MTVVPCSRAAAVSSSITSSPDTESSDPVGSSANSTSGPATRPRASATRCACPPDSSPDLRRSSPSRPSVPNHFLPAEPDLALLGYQDARQAVQQGGLARPARPHDRDDLALPDSQ